MDISSFILGYYDIYSTPLKLTDRILYSSIRNQSWTTPNYKGWLFAEDHHLVRLVEKGTRVVSPLAHLCCNELMIARVLLLQ